MPNADTDYLAKQEGTAGPETVGQQVRSDLVVRAERRNTVIRLRRMGLTYEAISEAVERDEETDFSISPEGARRIVHTYLDQMATQDRESIDQLRELENLRLDDMQKALQEKIRNGSVPAIKAALQVMERRAKLNGLDAPEVKGLVGAFLNVEDVANPEAVQEATEAFVAAFTKPGLPDVPKPAIEANGRERS